MHLFEKNIKDLGLIIPEPPSAVANYVPYKIIDNLVYVSGQAPSKNGKIVYSGKVGEKITDEEGVLAAQLCCMNIIAALKKSIDNDWDKLDNFVKLGGFVNSSDDFTQQPEVVNGASDLMVEVFGKIGSHSRFAVGSNSLPRGVVVEVEAIAEIH